MVDFSKLSLEELIQRDGFDCDCGCHHQVKVQHVKIGAGAAASLPGVLASLNVIRPFVVCDQNTAAIAWPKVKALLEKAQIPYQLFVFPQQLVEPDEAAVGALAMAFDSECDVILGVGSGVINDCCKVLAKVSARPSLIVATAPSMDGYASDSASMIQNRVKVSLGTPCPSAVIADTDIVANAPMRMLQAGLGDMMAKYTALCEWRIAHLVIGEYYCPHVAELVRCSLKKCVNHAEKLVLRDPDAVEAVMEGLIITGIAMSFAKCSRPASGLEHYFSHMWEMMALDKNIPADLHGIQVGVGTHLTLMIFDGLANEVPDWAQAHKHLSNFDEAAWEQEMREIFGKASNAVIQGERNKFHKNDLGELARRIHFIQLHWEEILTVLKQELPASKDLLALMRRLGMPAWPQELGLSPQDVKQALIGSRDIRDKYLVSSLLWDLGKLHDYANMLAASGKGGDSKQ